jgi:hypothetical protein
MRFKQIYGTGEASGRLGNVIASRNKSGPYLRPAVSVVVPNTARQQEVKTRLTMVSQAYAGLTAAQMLGWDTYAKNVTLPDRLGGRNTVSGAAMFNRTNMARFEAGGTTILADAPTEFYLGEKDTTASAAISEASQNISLTFDNTMPWATEAGGKLMVYMGIPQNPSRNFFNGPWSLAGTISGATPTAPTSPATIACPKPVAAGQKVWLQMRTLRADGRLSDPFRVDCVVGA